jgi:galactokinase
MNTLSGVSTAFAERFGGAPDLVVRAPGRVNLIGEHTDYNDGFVMPAAIDRWVWIALRPRHDTRVVLASLDFGGAADFDLAHLRFEKGWQEYVKGTAWALQQNGYRLCGFEGVVAGDVPIGAGLSSSAALETASARAFAAVSGLEWDATLMARVAQRAENDWVGVRCGIMDQMASAAGREGHALLIDCRSLETRAVPLPPESTVFILDTSTRRGLVHSLYNERRAQCEEAVRLLGARSLRDVSVEQIAARAGRTDAERFALRRARHVVTENARTLQAAEALCRGDVLAAGRLMDESHESLMHDFEVVTPALDTMTSCARRAPGCLGARMTGAGFGGCVVALVLGASAAEFGASVAARFPLETGLTPKIHSCSAAAGAEILAPTPA